jgi:hypothetical protein
MIKTLMNLKKLRSYVGRIFYVDYMFNIHRMNLS